MRGGGGYLMRQSSGMMPDVATPQQEGGIRGSEKMVEETEVFRGEGRGCAGGAGHFVRGWEGDGWAADVLAVEGEAPTGPAGGELFGALDAALFAGEAAATGFRVAFAGDGAAAEGLFGGFAFFHGQVWVFVKRSWWVWFVGEEQGENAGAIVKSQTGPRQPGPAPGLCQAPSLDEHPSLLLHPLDKLVPAPNNGTNPSQCPNHDSCNLPPPKARYRHSPCRFRRFRHRRPSIRHLMRCRRPLRWRRCSPFFGCRLVSARRVRIVGRSVVAETVGCMTRTSGVLPVLRGRANGWARRKHPMNRKRMWARNIGAFVCKIRRNVLGWISACCWKLCVCG